MTRHLCNAFSLNMLDVQEAVAVRVLPITLDRAKVLAIDSVSAVGHVDTAAVFAQLLERGVPYARVTLRLEPGDEALVGQYEGPRLPEGARSLPEGATIRWLLVRVESDAVGGTAR